MGAHRAAPASLSPGVRPCAVSRRGRGLRPRRARRVPPARRGTGIADARSGTVTVVQRFGSGLELTVHLHVLGLDGVFAAGTDGTPSRSPGPARSGSEVTRSLAAATR